MTASKNSLSSPSNRLNKRKIINDPVHGFITIPCEIIYDLIEHPFYQRLRRIAQLGLTSYVYPGAVHSRFHHALGAMHLMQQAIEVLRSKAVEITDEEAEAVFIAILLHDVGHAPFSHALEYSLLDEVNHETVSMLFMTRLNEEFGGKLSMAIEIFENRYHKKFLHQLVSSQLDMDRLDYLTRDSFFTGVQEGVVGSSRLIKMLNVHDDELAVEEKGIYSVEKFLISRRLMYWQVYLHRTVLVAEEMLVKILSRAKQLADAGTDLFATSSLKQFLYFNYNEQDFKTKPDLLEAYASLDDNDIWASLKEWKKCHDPILAELSARVIDRRLLQIELQNEAFSSAKVEAIKQQVREQYDLTEEGIGFFVFSGKTSNSAYSLIQDKINILYKNGEVKDIASASDQLNIKSLSSPVVKHYLCYPKNLTDIRKILEGATNPTVNASR